VSIRAYRQTARAETARETRRRIVMAFWDYAQTRWFDDITLDEVAIRAGVTVRTVIRQFGGREGLVAALPAHVRLEEIWSHAGGGADIDLAFDVILTLYEAHGDAILRLLAQEPRHPGLSPPLATAHATRIASLAKIFSPWLAMMADHERQPVVDALAIITDVHVWKGLRRDMGRTEGETKAILRMMAQAVLGQTRKAPPA